MSKTTPQTQGQLINTLVRSINQYFEHTLFGDGVGRISSFPSNATSTTETLGDDIIAEGKEWNECLTYAIGCIRDTNLFQCVQAATTCTGLSTVIKETKPLTKISNLTKDSIHSLCNLFFTGLGLPESYSFDTSKSHRESSWKEIGLVLGCASIPPYLINAYHKEDTRLAKTVNKGIITGAAVAWTFDQNLSLGATCGLISALPIDWVAEKIKDPLTDTISSFIKDSKIQETFNNQIELARYFINIPIVSLSTVYSMGLAPTFMASSVFSPLWALFAGSTASEALKIPLQIVIDIVKTAGSITHTFAKYPTIPLIALSSYVLTNSAQWVYGAFEKPLSYEEYLSYCSWIGRSYFNRSEDTAIEICNVGFSFLGVALTSAATGLITNSLLERARVKRENDT